MRTMVAYLNSFLQRGLAGNNHMELKPMSSVDNIEEEETEVVGRFVWKFMLVSFIFVIISSY